MTTFQYHPPVKELPGVHLVEGVIAGTQHTIAMVPRLQLSDEQVERNARLLADAPALFNMVQDLLMVCSGTLRRTDPKLLQDARDLLARHQ